MHSSKKLAKSESKKNKNNDDLKEEMNSNLKSMDSLLVQNHSYVSSSSQQSYAGSTSNVGGSQQHSYQQQYQYRRVRPEPINEKSIVGSVVGFLQDVVGNTENHHHNHNKHSQSQRQQPQHHGIVQSGSSTLLSNVTTVSPIQPSEIKEQIEWLHFEHMNLLEPSAASQLSFQNQNSKKDQSFNFSNSNILLVLGYKTGFSVWTIDVIIFKFFNFP